MESEFVNYKNQLENSVEKSEEQQEHASETRFVNDKSYARKKRKIVRPNMTIT